MEHLNFMKSKLRNTILTSRIKQQNRNRYLQKDLIQVCFVEHKILSKKHASMLFVKQMQILRIKNIRCKSLWILDKQLSNFINRVMIIFQQVSYFFSTWHNENKELSHEWTLLVIVCVLILGNVNSNKRTRNRQNFKNTLSLNIRPLSFC